MLRKTPSDSQSRQQARQHNIQSSHAQWEALKKECALLWRALVQKLSNVAGNHAEIGKKHFAAGLPGEAIFRFKIVTKLKPEDADGWAWLARAYGASGKPKEAVHALNEAKRLQPDHPELDAIYQAIIAPPVEEKAAEAAEAAEPEPSPAAAEPANG